MTDIAVIVPHPDDESALCAGFIQRAISKGAKVSVTFVTSGKNGRTLDLVTKKNLAAERRKEAVLACKALGVKAVHFLGYDDFNPRTRKFSTWPGATEKLLSKVRISKETLVVSFPPNGMNGHPDHVRCSALAIDVATQKGTALLCTTTPSADMSLGMTSYSSAKERRDFYLPPTHVLPLTAEEARGKLLALSGYRTQAISIVDFIRREKGNIAEEHFALAAPPASRAGKLLKKLGLKPAKKRR